LTDFNIDIRAGYAGGVLRLSMAILLARYTSLASLHWNVIKNHPELYNGIYSRTIAVGEELAYRWVCCKLHVSTIRHD
jgi:hypothetical protein